MNRKIIFFLTLAILICVAAPTAGAADVHDGVVKGVSVQDDISLYVDGKQIDDGGRSFDLDGTAYVPLIDVCTIFGVDSVSWDRVNHEATVYFEDMEVVFREDCGYVTANGRVILVDDAYIVRDNVLCVPAEVLCKCFTAGYRRNEGSDRVYIYTESIEPIESGDSYYGEDLYWLSRIIYAEAGHECLEGKIAVGNVILNRVASNKFPNTIYKVIFDRSCGIQFSPAYSGSIYRTPNSESVLAAKLVLEGVVVTEDALYFSPNSLATTSWAGRNRPYDTQIGGHTFFA